jgi:hypothetical protein
MTIYATGPGAWDWIIWGLAFILLAAWAWRQLREE